MSWAKHPLIDNYNQWADYVEDNDPHLRAFLELRIIVAALNEGWEPQFTEDERRYYPWFWLYAQEEIDGTDEEDKRRLISTGDYHSEYAGFACATSSYAPSSTTANFGSRLCLKSEALADYCGKQFINLWTDYCLIRRR